MRRLIWLLLLATTGAASAQQLPTKVVLDHETFSPTAYAGLQQLADKITATMDQLIPGRMSEYVRGDIVCFQVTSQTLIRGDDPTSRPPITISTNYKLSYEPASTVAGRTRIALFEVEPIYTRSYLARFAYQLSHELAHVKMGVRIDNYLVETLAIAVSHEVLIRLGMVAYANLEFTEQMHHLPDKVQHAYASRDMVALQCYWQSRASLQASAIGDRPFQSLGAALIRTAPVPWSALLGIAFATDCALSTPPVNVRICAPNLRKMTPIASILLSLGYRPT